MWDWGDGNQTIWIGAYESGETIKVGWIYTQPGSYSIKVKAKDIEDYESDWSEPLIINIRKDRNIQRPLFQYLLERFQNFLHIFYKMYRSPIQLALSITVH
jgi:hypothetical protein